MSGSPDVNSSSKLDPNNYLFILSPSESGQRSVEDFQSELESLHRKIKRMHAYENDLNEELSSCQEENKGLNKKLEEALKNGKSEEVNNFVEDINNNSSFLEHVESSSSINETIIIGELKEQLRKTKENLTALENKNYDMTHKVDELTEQKQHLEETIKEFKDAIKLADDENTKLEQENRNMMVTLTEKDGIIESLKKHIFQLKEILNSKKNEKGSAWFGKCFAPNKSLDTSTDYGFLEETFNRETERMNAQLRESKLAVEVAEEKLKTQSNLAMEAAKKKYEAELLEIKKTFESHREEIKLAVKEETEMRYSQKFNVLERKLLESHRQSVAATEEKYQSELLKLQKLFESEREEIKLSAVRETKIKYGERFESMKAEMGHLLQAEVDKGVKLKETLQESALTQSVLVENFNFEVAKAQAYEEEIENQKRKRAQTRSQNVELHNENFELKVSLEKQQRRVEEVEQELKSLRPLVDCPPPDPMSTKERFSEIRRRNQMQPPHMKSVYPSEFMTCDDDEVTEEELKQLPGHKTFNNMSGSSLNHRKGILPFSWSTCSHDPHDHLQSTTFSTLSSSPPSKHPCLE